MNTSLIQPLNEKKYFYAIFASILAAVLLMASIGPSLLAAATDDDDDGVVSFKLNTIGGSGIEGHILLVDTGTENVYVGVATGLTIGVPYVSLNYDIKSPVSGPQVCEPAIPDGEEGALTFDQMFIGQWVPLDSSIRTLEMRSFGELDPGPPLPDPQTSKTGAQYTPIEDIGTISIREPPFGPGPEFVVACGETTDDRDIDEDSDSDSS